jgi:hypothetical protein
MIVLIIKILMLAVIASLALAALVATVTCALRRRAGKHSETCEATPEVAARPAMSDGYRQISSCHFSIDEVRQSAPVDQPQVFQLAQRKFPLEEIAAVYGLRPHPREATPDRGEQ